MNILPLFSVLKNLTFFIIIILTFFLLAEQRFVGAVDPYYLDCSVPATACGDNRTIRFPFYRGDQQKHYCGYPGFELSCDEHGHSILNNISNNDPYIVRQISYQNRSLILSNAAIAHDSTPNCIPRIQNLSFPNEKFELYEQNQLFLLYNCQHPPTDPKYKIGCYSQNATNWVVGVPENEKGQLGNLSSKCGQNRRLVVAPVKDYNSSDERIGIKQVLSRGFELIWKADDCSRCEESGGACGFNTSSYLFRCYCKDRPHRVRCQATTIIKSSFNDDTSRYLDRKIKTTTVAVSRKMVEDVDSIEVIEPVSEKHNMVIKVTIVVAAIFGALIAIVICMVRKFKYKKSIFFWKKHNQTEQSVEAFLRDHGPVRVRRYSYLEVKKMTNSFKEKLGQGGYGSVYKGNLHDGSLVAVKMLKDSKGNGEEFINEVATISRTSHVNVVNLLGFCYEGRKRALIYEFMPNKSLDKFIFDNDCLLGWETLYRISLGIARGLEYLHRGCNTRILHFDIKPHNILLDDDFSPKISDFGLARVCTRKQSIISMLDARGTIGYIAPEVFCRAFGGVSHKSDVYSYGMMVLDMVEGRKNVNVGVDHSSEIYFPHWIYNRLELDEELGLKRIMNQVEKTVVKKMIIVSLWCTQTDPSNRPAMNRVIEMLEGSLDSLQMPPKPPISSSPSDSSFPHGLSSSTSV